MPFDIVNALNGARIVTKAGLPVAHLQIQKANNAYPIKGFFRNLTGQWESATWNLKGEFTNNVDGPKNLMLQEFTQEWFPITIWPGIFEGKAVYKEVQGKTIEERHFRLWCESTDETWEGVFPYLEEGESPENIKATHWANLAPTPKEMAEHKRLMSLRMNVGEDITSECFAIHDGELKPIEETPYKREIGNKCQTIDQVTIFKNPYLLPIENNEKPVERANENKSESTALRVVKNPTN